MTEEQKRQEELVSAAMRILGGRTSKRKATSSRRNGRLGGAKKKPKNKSNSSLQGLTVRLSCCQMKPKAKRKAAFKTNDAGTRFTVAIFIKNLDQQKTTHEAASLLHEIANGLDQAEYLVTNAPETSIA
jgi:hypothetical protein